MTDSVRYRIVVLAALLLAFRLWLSAALPVTGDEAYFIYWGATPTGFLRPSADGRVVAVPAYAVLRGALGAAAADTVLAAVLAAGIYLALRRRDPDGRRSRRSRSCCCR